MDRAEIVGNLCWYDKRHPDFIEDEYTGKMTPRLPRCGRDSCFSGRDRLAVAPLDAAEREEEAAAALQTRVKLLEETLRWLHDRQDTSLHEDCTADGCLALAVIAGKDSDFLERLGYWGYCGPGAKKP